MKDYSQSGEQRVILDYFQAPRWPYMIGRFLDIGCNDFLTFSNTRALFNLGWKGVLVDASAAAIKLIPNSLSDFEKESAPLIINAAITTQDGPIDLYDSGTHLKKGDVALLSTTVPSEMDRWKKSGEQFTKTTVRGITFETLMKEAGVSHFDFISLDAEGMDYEILKQIDLTAVGCQLLCVEFNQKNKQRFIDYCTPFGMQLLHATYENLIFSREWVRK